MNLNINGDRGQKRFLYGFINNPALGSILIKFNFYQQDNVFKIKTHVIGEFLCFQHKYLLSKTFIKKNIFIDFFPTLDHKITQIN